MLSIETVRENPERVKESQKKRGDSTKIVDRVQELDEEWREKLQELENLRQKRNEKTDEIEELKKKGEDAEEEVEEMREVKSRIQNLEPEVEKLKERRNKKLARIPAILHESVPRGGGEEDNVEIRRWGEPPEFDFEPKIHTEILENLGLLDLDRGAKVAGSDFYYMKGDLARLDRAIMKFAVDFLRDKGYEFVLPPLFVNRDVYEAMLGAKGSMGEASYKIEDKELWAIPTSEYPLGGMHKDEVFLEEELPKKFCSFSPCFRREGGGHGKYSRGLYRVHQFNKVEQFIYSRPENSWDFHEELQENAEKLYQKMGLAYRVVNVCTGDMGSKAAKKYDTECWMADGNYHETGSNSNCLDYQARDLNIKYRRKEGEAPEGCVHTLNNTALATSRTIIAIVEQYQQEDGTVKIPEALQPYMDGQEFIGKED